MVRYNRARPMNTPTPIAPERLAALIEGRLSGADAAALRVELASADDDTLAAYGDAIAIAGDNSSIPALRSRFTWRNGTLLAMAATIVVAVALQRRALPQADYQPQRLATVVGSQAARLDAPVWSAMRGGATSLSRTVISARAGALLMDLEIAQANIEAGAMQRLARELTALVGELPGGVVAATAYKAGGTLSPTDRRVAGEQVVRLLDGRIARAATYLEAARLATSSGDSLFFERQPPAPITSLDADIALVPAARTALNALSALLAAHSHDASALNIAVTELLRAMTQ
ncbi:MAG: hypothetical protein JWM95_4262 [Gemmatimonadetes bacterium]|nr:hypothetical protein [Gemmatimonadota bacterium]